MNCPIDGTTLVMSDRNGIEIDYCPQCRGIWLDKGELDKIIERAAQYEQQMLQQVSQHNPPQPPAPAQAPAAPQPPAQSYPPQPTAPQPPAQSYPPQPQVIYVDDDDYRKVHYDQYGRPYKKKSMWGEIFDIFD